MSRVSSLRVLVLLAVLLPGLPISVRAETPPPDNLMQAGDVSLQLPGESWLPIDQDELPSHRATAHFADALKHEEDAVVAVLFIQPWETVPARPTTVEAMDEYLTEVEAEISAARDDVAVIARNTATSDEGAVLGLLHVLRNSSSLSADLGWSDQYAVHQLGWSVAAESGLVQLYVYVRDDDASGSLIGKLSAPNAYSFYLTTADPPPQREERRSWFTVLALFIGLLAVALLGLRIYQRHRARSREEEFDVEANSARPTPVTPWEDELDEIFDGTDQNPVAPLGVEGDEPDNEVHRDEPTNEVHGDDPDNGAHGDEPDNGAHGDDPDGGSAPPR